MLTPDTAEHLWTVRLTANLWITQQLLRTLLNALFALERGVVIL